LEETIIYYEFEEYGLSLQCDGDEKIATIMIHAAAKREIDRSLFHVPLTLSREEVLSCFGQPTSSADRRQVPPLGEYGGYDRFDFEHGVVHFEYVLDSSSIKLVTLMRSDAAP